MGAGMADATTVSLAVWEPSPTAIARMLRKRSGALRRLRADPDVRSVHLLGTGNERFTPLAVDVRRWVLLVVWRSARSTRDLTRVFGVTRLRRQWTARLAPLASRGRWAGREPFVVPASERTDADRSAAWNGPVLALTRARLRPSRAPAFWRAVPSIAVDTAQAPGLTAAFGVGETPLSPGTMSWWSDLDAERSFVRRSIAHRRAIADTVRIGWYSEELFARFAIVDAEGSTDVLRPAHERIRS